jgi:hypothetical protein
MLSAMLWFRADRAQDEVVRTSLLAACELLASFAPARLGHRHEEDRPYRTWMVDAGPVPDDQFDALLARLEDAFTQAGVPALAQGTWQLERFQWLPRADS